MHKEIKKSEFLNGTELQKGKKTQQKSPIGFTPKDNNGIGWLTCDILYSLWRIGYCLGSFATELSGSLLVTVKHNDIALDMYKTGFVIHVPNGTGLIEGGIYLIELQNGLNIMLHKKVTNKGIEKFINEVHQMAEDYGEYKEGELLFKESTAIIKIVPTLHSVDEMFSLASLVGPIMSDVTEEDVLSTFDAPERLSFITNDLGKFLVLTEQKEEQETLLLQRIKDLKTAGVDISNIENLDWEEILSIRESLDHKTE